VRRDARNFPGRPKPLGTATSTHGADRYAPHHGYCHTTAAMPRGSTTPQPTILTLRVAQGEAEARTDPNLMYAREAAARATALVGRDAYTVLRTKALQALAAQRAAIDAILAPLEAGFTAFEAASTNGVTWTIVT
jgi:hypothetical protein